jgi:release factor glutamine methyltransferase
MVFDAARVLSSPAGVEAFCHLAAVAREAGAAFDEATHPLGALARGRPVARAALDDSLGAAHAEALFDCGAFASGDPAVPAFGLAVTGRVVVPVPAPEPSTSDTVYIGPDSALLVEAIWRRAAGGARAADLGAGTGFLAAVLTARYDLVVATELGRPAAATTALTLALNPPPDDSHRAAVCLTDIAAALRPDSFDLVTVNPPWVPESPDGKPPRLFADGGPTGFELPRRFIAEGVALLRPGGLFVMVTLDATFRDGARPLHEARDGLVGEGLEAEVEPTRLQQLRPGFERNITDRWPAITAAGHSALVVRRPPAT